MTGCCSCFGADTVGVLALDALAFFLEANPLSHPGADMFNAKGSSATLVCAVFLESVDALRGCL